MAAWGRSRQSLAVGLAALLNVWKDFWMSEEERIDHRDLSGEHREGVFRFISEALCLDGERPPSADFFIGDWTMAFFDGRGRAPHEQIRFNEDGSAPCKALDGSYDNPKDGWEFHNDCTVSLWTHIDPMPQYGINEPTYEENRYHALKGGENRFVLINGDGSIVMIFERSAA